MQTTDGTIARPAPRSPGGLSEYRAAQHELREAVKARRADPGSLVLLDRVRRARAQVRQVQRTRGA